MPAVTPRAVIDRFLASKRIAFVGLSQNTKDFSRLLFREFVERGYDPIPVHPRLTEAEGRACYSNVANIPPPVEAAIVMTSAARSEQVVRECAASGIPRVWLYRAVGKGAVSESALAACAEMKIEVVAGECPFMFFSSPGFPHNFHGYLRRILGTYPA